MSYCTADDVGKMIPSAVLIRLTDDENAGAVDADRLTEAVDTAADEIDTYLGARYDLPLTDTVPILGKLNVDMAIYNLYSRYKDEIPQTRKDRYTNAIRFLEKVAEGKISLGVQPVPDPAGAGDYDGGAQVTVRDTDFDSTTMGKF